MGRRTILRRQKAGIDLTAPLVTSPEQPYLERPDSGRTTKVWVFCILEIGQAPGWGGTLSEASFGATTSHPL